MINKVVLTGRLTKDVKLERTPSGIPFVRFNLAVNRTFSGNNGEREADFPNCIAWRKQAENMEKFLKKGSLVGLEGRVQTGSYKDKDTNKMIYTTEMVAEMVHFLEPKKTDSRPAPSDYEAPPEYGGYSSGQVNEDDLPF